MTGSIITNYAKEEFLKALEQYKEALRTGKGIVEASVRIHFLKSGVPKTMWKMVNRAYESNGK